MRTHVKISVCMLGKCRWRHSKIPHIQYDGPTLNSGHCYVLVFEALEDP